jgi:hypothetical protein
MINPPPQNTVKNESVDLPEANAVGSPGVGADEISGPSTYALLRREGEIHEGRITVLDDLRRNIARLEDLHGQLSFLMKEVVSVLRR